MAGQQKKLKAPENPAELCLNGRLWAQFGEENFHNSGKKRFIAEILSNIGLRILKQILH